MPKSPIDIRVLRLGGARRLSRVSGPGPYPELNSPRIWETPV
jgi:hypothetical protein